MVTSISRDELHAKIQRRDAFHLFEVLGPMYFRKHHLPGAKNVPPGEVGTLVPQLVPDRDAEIVVYCWDDGWPTSKRAARELAAMGYTNVRDYAEGKKGWQDAGFPLTKD